MGFGKSEAPQDRVYTLQTHVEILGLQNSAAVDDAWIRAYSAPFPDRGSCIGGIEFPLDVHYARFQDFVFTGLQTGNLEAVKAKPAMLAMAWKTGLSLLSRQWRIFACYFQKRRWCSCPVLVISVRKMPQRR
jgi:hypothetical protein